MYSWIIFRGFLNANLGKYGQLTAIALSKRILFNDPTYFQQVYTESQILLGKI